MHSLNSGKTWHYWNTSNYTILSHFYQPLFSIFSLTFTFFSVFICCKHHLQVIICRENASWKLMIDWWDVNDCLLGGPNYKIAILVNNLIWIPACWAIPKYFRRFCSNFLYEITLILNFSLSKAYNIKMWKKLASLVGLARSIGWHHRPCSKSLKLRNCNLNVSSWVKHCPGIIKDWSINF